MQVCLKDWKKESNTHSSRMDKDRWWTYGSIYEQADNCTLCAVSSSHLDTYSRDQNEAVMCARDVYMHLSVRNWWDTLS